MTNTDYNILVVEDEPSQMELLCYNLVAAGYSPFRAETAEEGLLILEEEHIDLILLDWMLPNLSGLEACRQIKRNKKTRKTPVLMLTARGEEEDKIRGLDTGADGYIVKPYSIKELLAHIRAALRRIAPTDDVEKLNHEGLSMDLVRHVVSLDGNPISLGPTEFKLLKVLMESPGRVYSRDQLLSRVWKEELGIETRTVDVHIGRLRKQLSANNETDYIRTIRGFGYSLGSADAS